jgi:hypothetical protein
MSTLEIRHPDLPKLWAWPARALARGGAFLASAFGVFAEAQETMRQAERRCSFMLEG